MMSRRDPRPRRERIAEVKYGENWLEDLSSALEKAKIDNPQSVLVTDRMGVEVRCFDTEDFYLDVDRFPVRAFFAPDPQGIRPAKTGTPTGEVPLLERGLSTKTQTSLESWTSDDISPGAQKFGQDQISKTLQFADVWPGILVIKLGSVAGREQVCDALRSVFATDATGVEMDISRYVDRMPDPSHFPLKLHFRAQGANTRQNWEDDVDMSQDLSSCEHKPTFKATNKGDQDTECRHHSTDLAFESILLDVINARLRHKGHDISPMRRPSVLVTDRIGVQVVVNEGVPDSSRFPLKFHIDDTGMDLEPRNSSMMQGHTLRLSQWAGRKRNIFKRGLSKLSGS